mgnify:CR=1 FL=1
MLESAGGRKDVSGFALAVALRDHFPQLSSAELHLLVSTAMRMRGH